jgi:hypothetical protein
MRADRDGFCEAARPRRAFDCARVMRRSAGWVVPPIGKRIVHDRKRDRPHGIAFRAIYSPRQRFAAGRDRVQRAKLLRAQNSRDKQFSLTARTVSNDGHHRAHAKITLRRCFEHETGGHGFAVGVRKRVFWNRKGNSPFPGFLRDVSRSTQTNQRNHYATRVQQVRTRQCGKGRNELSVGVHSSMVS